MSVIFAGNELESFQLRGVVMRTSVVASKFDADFCRSAMELADVGDDVGIARSFTGGSEFWMHFHVVSEAGAGSLHDKAIFRAMDRLNARTVFKLEGNNGSYVGNYWNGSSYSIMSNSFALLPDTLVKIDIHVKIHDTLGRFAIYLNDVLHEEFLGDTNLYAGAQVDELMLQSPNNVASYAQSYAFSEVIVADEPTVGWRVATIVPSSAGATSGWTGAYTDVDEIEADDSDYLESIVADQVTTMGASNLSAIAAAMQVQTFGIAARARRGGSGIQQMQMAIRTGAADFFSGTLALDPGFRPIDAFWALNPDTVAQWTFSEIDGLELGVKSIT